MISTILHIQPIWLFQNMRFQEFVAPLSIQGRGNCLRRMWWRRCRKSEHGDLILWNLAYLISSYFHINMKFWQYFDIYHIAKVTLLTLPKAQQIQTSSHKLANTLPHKKLLFKPNPHAFSTYRIGLYTRQKLQQASKSCSIFTQFVLIWPRGNSEWVTG